MKKVFFIILGVALIGVGLYFMTNSSSTKDASNNNKNSIDISKVEKSSVVASFYPLAFMAEEIGGELVEVKNLAGSVSAHKYQLTPQDLVSLNEADLVLVQGINLEPWSDDMTHELSEKGVLTLKVTEGLSLYKPEEHNEHDNENAHSNGDGHDEHKEVNNDEYGYDEHNHGAFDPHTWLDPVLAQQMVDNISKAMQEMRPTDAKVFQDNADKLKVRLQELNISFAQGLSSCEQTEVIVSHNAYGYLAHHYGFQTHAIAGLSVADEPSAKILTNLKAEAKDGITHILIEENSVRKFADTLINETGLIPLPVNPLGRGTLDKNKNFFDVMEANLQSFKTGLNCK